jgi:hypothetical protein
MGLYNLGWIALLQGDLRRAADVYRESLSLAWVTGVNPQVQREYSRKPERPGRRLSIPFHPRSPAGVGAVRVRAVRVVQAVREPSLLVKCRHGLL